MYINFLPYLYRCFVQSVNINPLNMTEYKKCCILQHAHILRLAAACTHLEDKLQQGEHCPHVDVLVLVVPGTGQAGVEAQEGEGAEHIFIKGLIVTVDVVGHLTAAAGQDEKSAQHVSTACQRSMSAQHASTACQHSMPAQHVSTACQHSMSAQHVND
jgi:hypothetical protein